MKTIRPLAVLSFLALAAHLSLAGDQKQAAEASAGASSDDAAVIALQMPYYPLRTCVVSGETLGDMGEPVNVVRDGRLVRFCCQGCVPGFEKKSAEYLAKLDEAVKADQAPLWPLEACPVSGEPYGGEMGDAVEVVYGGYRYVKFCCKGCVRQFNKNPEKTLAKIDAALIESQRKTYPLDTCVVSGEKLEEPVDYLYGVHLVRLCCKNCRRTFDKNPDKYLTAVRN